ncbi:Hsp70 family protein [Schaalia sp. ZJ405]|uniref:Hsp70 family protein n=1 Tax=Schaalia sp. ZJ405 TaxID=2709403 RepID=UPI0013EC7649|nr:Hsp70 family protein [Schaalia sp. ZJ405]QPK82108.1 Hsp70 family protein [Schaalia sp. ZJ405]
MRLGVDFGTTTTTVAVADRGNYPAVSFIDHNGDAQDDIPSVIGWSNGALVFGFDALRAMDEDEAPLIRSIKRLLSDSSMTPRSTFRLAQRDISIMDALVGFLGYVAFKVRTDSSLAQIPQSEPLEAAIGIPAHASSAQRFLTLETFRAAGWSVISMVSEPSAAGFEYTHRHRGTLNSKRTSILVYDLGGGTFDASTVTAVDTDHQVLASRGHTMLGGDDFDLVLAQCFAKAGDIPLNSFAESEWQDLVEQSRTVKESLTAHTRVVSAVVHDRPVSLPVSTFYEAATPLVEKTLQVLSPLLQRNEDGALALPPECAGIYVTGGASSLPLVSRILRERFGRRVHRSPHAAASTAIGLAIAADPDAGFTLHDRLARHVGVFREAESGSLVSFDTLLSPDLQIESNKETTITRQYRAAHNIGFYRFVEFTQTDHVGTPLGDVTPLGEILFPFAPALQEPDISLANMHIARTGNGPLIEERYHVDRHGIVTVEIYDLDTGYSLTSALTSGT